jgi:hypothetical protein
VRIVFVFWLLRIVSNPFNRIQRLFEITRLLEFHSLRQNRSKKFLCSTITSPDVAEFGYEELNYWAEHRRENSELCGRQEDIPSVLCDKNSASSSKLLIDFASTHTCAVANPLIILVEPIPHKNLGVDPTDEFQDPWVHLERSPICRYMRSQDDYVVNRSYLRMTGTRWGSSCRHPVLHPKTSTLQL